MMHNNIHHSRQNINRILASHEERLTVFNALSPEDKRVILLKIPDHIKYDIISKLSIQELVQILNEMDTDDAVDILQLLPLSKKEQAIQKLNEPLKSNVHLLLKFDPDTAGGLMNIDFIKVDQKDTFVHVSNRVKRAESKTGKIPTILVMHDNKLSGFLPGYELGLGDKHDQIADHVKHIKIITHHKSIDDVLDVFRTHSYSRLVVVDENENILGVIYSEDVIKILQKEESASLYDFAGVHDEEAVFDSIKSKVQHRYKWLIINLGTAFLAAFTVGLFEDVISKYVLLAVYMPIVAGMGGNAGTQTLAVLVRGITLKQIDLSTAWNTIKNEVGAGFINGLINGLIVFLIVFFKDNNIKIALILGLAMVINLLIAGLFGTFVPLLMKKLGNDPASSATIFITTATDVLGFFAFLGLASLILL